MNDPKTCAHAEDIYVASIKDMKLDDVDETRFFRVNLICRKCGARLTGTMSQLPN